MTRRFWLWAVGVVFSALLIVGGVVFWLLATESGARWLMARATPLLPPSLQIKAVEGTVLEGIDLRSASWTDEQVQVSVELLHTKFELLPLLRRQVRINRLDVRNVDVNVSAGSSTESDGAPFSIDLPVAILIEAASVSNAHIATSGGDLEIQRIELSGQLSGSALKIGRLEVQSELGDINLSGDVRLTGAYPAALSAAWKLQMPDLPPMSGNIRLQGDSVGYEIEHNLNTPVEIMTQGTLAIVDNEIVADLVNTWKQLSIDTGDTGAVDIEDGALSVIGTVNEFSFDGSSTVVYGDVPPLAVAARGVRKADRIGFESVSVSNDWGKLLASGEAFVAPEFSSNVIVDITALVPDLNRDVKGQPVTASGALSYSNRELQVENAVIIFGDNRADFAGSYGPNLQGNAVLRLPNLDQLGIDAAGVLNGEIQFSSDLKSFAATGSLNGEDLTWKDYVAHRISAEFDLPKTGSGDATLQVADARIGSLLLSAGRLTATGSRQSHNVKAEIVAELGRGEFELNGSYSDEVWSAIVSKLHVGSEQLGEWFLREASNISLSRSGIEIANTCLITTSNTGIACGLFDYDVAGSLRFDASVNELPLAAFAVNLPEGAEVKGSIEAKASGEFVNQRLTANALLNVRNLALKAIFEGDEVSASFEQARASASITENHLIGDLELRLADQIDHLTAKVEVDDIFDQQSRLRGHSSLELNDLSLFSFFYPDISNPTGRIDGRVDIAGSPEAPEIVGEIGLRSGSFGVRRAGIVVSDAELLLRQAKAGHLALQGSLRSGEGHLRMQGETTLSSQSGIRTELTLKGENFALIQLPDWRVTASPDIAVLFDDRETRVTGKLGIPTASISIHEVPETAARPSPDVVVHRADELATAQQRVTYVDVRTSLGDEVFLSGFGLTTGLEGSVRIVGNSNTPYTSSGRVVLRDGRYQAYGQNLEIESGELIFNGPISDPTLNIRATRTASDKTVAGIHLTGTPKQLKSSVYSEPQMADAEALSYLLTGRPLQSADSADGDMLNQAAFALGLTSAGSIASRIRNDLGFETLGVQGGGENRQLVAGKRFGERLLVEYAYGIVDNLGTLLLRYQLSSRLILESRSGSVRNLDVVYSVKKK